MQTSGELRFLAPEGLRRLKTSVGDQDPQDPHVFGPPGPDPLVICADPDPAPAPDPSHSLKNVLSGLK